MSLDAYPTRTQTFNTPKSQHSNLGIWFALSLFYGVLWFATSQLLVRNRLLSGRLLTQYLHLENVRSASQYDIGETRKKSLYVDKLGRL